MLFLGTGAAEAIPNPMCGCETCRRALSGQDPRDIRARSSFLLDAENLIDCGPDVISACGRMGQSLEKLKRIFLTHAHGDHFDLATLENLQMCISDAPELKIYVSQAVYEGFMRLREMLRQHAPASFGELRWAKHCTFVPVEPFREYDLGDFTFSAVVGRHGGMFREEQSLNYLFQKNGKRLFYACDTGLLYPETYDHLRGKRLDILIIENTFGKAEILRTKGHHNLEHLYETMDALIAQGTVDGATAIYITHIGHKDGLLHEEMNAVLQARYGGHICAAYDGLRI